MTVVLLTKETCFVLSPTFHRAEHWTKSILSWFLLTPSLLPLDLDFPPLFHPKDLGHSNIYMSNIISLFLTIFFFGLVCPTPHKKKWGKTNNPPPPKKNNQSKKTCIFNSCRKCCFPQKKNIDTSIVFCQNTAANRSCFGALPPRPSHLLERSLGRLRDAVAGQLREVLSISVSVVGCGGKNPGREGRPG